MRVRSLLPVLALTLSACGLVAGFGARAEDMALSVRGAPSPLPHAALGTRTPAEARAAGVAWLKQHQAADGGWGAGNWGQQLSDAPTDVATTAYVAMALLRDAGGGAAHGTEIRRAVTYVAGAVTAQPDGARVATAAGTQPQYKLGELIDTHLAAMLLGQVRDRYQGELGTQVRVAYDLAVTKVQRAQNADVSFDANGWAPVLSSSIAAQSLYQAKLAGAEVDDEVLARADAYQAAVAGGGSGAFDTSAGAGVPLYAVASTTAANEQVARRERARGQEGDAAAIATAEASAASGYARISEDAGLVLGFGSIGGEEMLSYQMISDTLASRGGADWTRWRDQMGQYLASIQNADGSWVGHHCITSPIFVTAGAVMTLAAGPA